jgi:hypothetical protein
MTGVETAWYVTRLAQIPSSPLTATGVLDGGAGAAECRRIGAEIHRLHGADGMVEVCCAYREALDAETAEKIGKAWTGIGQWQG